MFPMLAFVVVVNLLRQPSCLLKIMLLDVSFLFIRFIVICRDQYLSFLIQSTNTMLHLLMIVPNESAYVGRVNNKYSNKMTNIHNIRTL